MIDKSIIKPLNKWGSFSAFLIKHFFFYSTKYLLKVITEIKVFKKYNKYFPRLNYNHLTTF